MRSLQQPATKWRLRLVKSEQLKDLLHTARLPRRDALALILASQNGQPIQTTEIIKIGKDSGIRNISTWNVTQYLNSNKTFFVKLPTGWILGPNGRPHIDALVAKITGGQPAVVSHSLRLLIPKLSNEEAKAFVGEAISCYEAKCYRAAVVLSWVGAVAVLHNHIITHHLVTFNAEMSARRAKRNPPETWKLAKNTDDLALMSEGELLEVLAAVSVIGKSVKELLKNQCLGLRNGCGHPNSVQPGENMVAAHLEILINHIFTKF